MNIVDYVIIGIVAVSVLFGLYRGFVASVLNLGGGLIAFLLSFVAYPRLAAYIQGNQELVRTLLHYTDATSRIGDLELAITNVMELGQQGIRQVLEKVNLPAPLDAILQSNLENQVYAASGITSVSDYVSQTILQACINILCFLVCFLVLFVLVSIVFSVIRAVFRFPILKQLDSLAGGVFGFLRALIICLAVFTLIPLVQTVVPMEQVDELIEGSQLAPIFLNGNLIRAIMNHQL